MTSPKIFKNTLHLLLFSTKSVPPPIFFSTPTPQDVFHIFSYHEYLLTILIFLAATEGHQLKAHQCPSIIPFVLKINKCLYLCQINSDLEILNLSLWGPNWLIQII